MEYANARTGAMTRRTTAKDAILRHSAATNCVVAEYSLPGGRSCTLLLPLSDGLRLFSTLVGEGRFSVRAQIGNETATFLASKAEPTEAALFVECVRERKRLDPAAARASRAAIAAARTRAEEAGRNNLMAGFARAVQGQAVPGASSSSARGAGVGSAATLPPATSAQLSDEQAAVVELIKGGTSVFFTGGAGTGKSVVLSALRATLPASTTAFTGRRVHTSGPAVVAWLLAFQALQPTYPHLQHGRCGVQHRWRDIALICGRRHVPSRAIHARGVRRQGGRVDRRPSPLVRTYLS